MSHFGDLLAGKPNKIGSGEPDVVETPASKKDFKKQSKVELEEYGRTVGIELDRRKSKDKLIQELIDYEGKTTL